MGPLIHEFFVNNTRRILLKRLRHSHHNVIFSYLNINSISNEFGHLNKIVDGNIDILYIAETK